MASEYETQIRADQEAQTREDKVTAFLNSVYAGQVADLAIASYWDHIQAKLHAEGIGRQLAFVYLDGGLSRSEKRALRSEQAAAYTESAFHFSNAAAYASIAGAVEIAATQRNLNA